jgi:Glycosyl transferase family 2
MGHFADSAVKMMMDWPLITEKRRCCTGATGIDATMTTGRLGLPSQPGDFGLRNADECKLLDRGAIVGSRIFILLSTHNGATYLRAQLESLMTQTHANWVLYWRDDGSTDATVTILTEFAETLGSSRCVRILEPTQRLWPAASYMALLRAAAPALGASDSVAFVDQDDVWLPDKLARGVAAMTDADRNTPTLYCARLMVVDASLQHIRETSIFPQRCGFPASLTQNIAAGCTIVLNRRAVALVAESMPPSASPHDWWCYLLVTAAGGRVVVDDAVVALYRQHRGNHIGVPPSTMRRAIAALRRGPGVFMNVLRQHLAALIARPDLMCETAQSNVRTLHRALQGNFRQKLRALRLPGLCRQNRLETALFRLWFLIG